ncbi:MAG: hypothetical protein R3D63_12435 [Paracoccaceae bacterium]
MRDDMRAHARLLFAGLASFVLMGFGQSLFGPTLPEVTRLFSLGGGVAPWLISALWVGSATGVGLMYVLGDHVRPRHAIGMLFLGATGLTLQPGWAAMLLAALVFGTGYGLATATFNPRVLRAFGPRGASMLSLLNAAFALGAIIAPLIFVALGGVSALVFGITAAGCLLVWALAGERADPARTAPPPPRPGYRVHWPSMGFGLVGIGIESCLIGLGPTALIASGTTEPEAARLLSAFFVAFLSARVVLGVMAHRVQPFTLYLAGMLWAVGSALVAALWAPGPAFVALGISAGMFFPGFFVAASRKMGDDPRVTPVILSAGLVGGIGAPVVMGQVMQAAGPRGFFWILLAIAVPTALAALALRRRMNG